MIKNFLIALATLGALGTVAVFAVKSGFLVGRNGSKIYKMAPEVIVVIVVVAVGVVGITALATGSLKTDFHLSW